MPDDESDEPEPELGSTDRRDLERLAWGSGTEDALRAAARAELRRRDDTTPEATDDVATTRVSAESEGEEPFGERPAAVRTPDVFGDPLLLQTGDARAEEPAGGVRRRRILIGAVAVAAGFAVVAGASFFSRAEDGAGGEDAGVAVELGPDDLAGAAAETDETVDPRSSERPAQTTRALNVFAREQTDDDVPADPPPALEPASFRLLYTDPSGWTGYVAMRRTELCLMVRTPEGSDFFTCAQSIGEFLDDGALRLSFSIDGRQTDVRWRRDGAFHLYVRN
ncbi:hypothetical protein [Agromyces seonyuensis]|uniref:Uncharacterized protein n=1 Tax=Agromyces seonyuensis TaxID=2662446 RepID=A0A6I4NZU4_9MICO|nr:hypothetical protein [Agromyces seonyuensis]MWB97955.1 hypothetical protein [Agromyces seonyuensis]